MVNFSPTEPLELGGLRGGKHLIGMAVDLHIAPDL